MRFLYDLSNFNGVAFLVICEQSIAKIHENWFIAIYFPKRVEKKVYFNNIYDCMITKNDVT